jgi:uncharacterized RDD family membrane protein YckC
LLSQISDDEIAAPTVNTPLTTPTAVERPERAEAVDIESDGGIAFDPDLASFGSRLGGLLIDGAIVLLSLVPGLLLLFTGSPPLVLLGIALMAVGFAGVAVLYGRAVAATGQWVGNRVTNTKVVDARNGRLVSGSEAGLRFVVRFSVSTILLIGFLVAFGNSQRRTFHDNVAGTVVTRPPRATWSIDDEVTDG